MLEIRFVYGENPIQTVGVECPECGGWFRDKDIIPLWQCYSASSHNAVMNLPLKCPQCKHDFIPFENGHTIREYDTQEEVYKDTLHSVTHWEK